MDEPLLLGPFSRTTHSRLAKACMATSPLVDALRTVAKPLAARRPTQQVPAAVHAEAVSLLAAARKALSRQPGMGHRLALGERCDWATLLCELEFAMTGFEAFRALCRLGRRSRRNRLARRILPQFCPQQAGIGEQRQRLRRFLGKSYRRESGRGYDGPAVVKYRGALTRCGRQRWGGDGRISSGPASGAPAQGRFPSDRSTNPTPVCAERLASHLFLEALRALRSGRLCPVPIVPLTGCTATTFARL